MSTDLTTLDVRRAIQEDVDWQCGTLLTFVDIGKAFDLQPFTTILLTV